MSFHHHHHPGALPAPAQTVGWAAPGQHQAHLVKLHMVEAYWAMSWAASGEPNHPKQMHLPGDAKGVYIRPSVKTHQRTHQR